MTATVTTDGFLGGRLAIMQPADGYRAGVDPVFLAAAVPARAGDRVLDLGCGVGTAALCLAARVPGVVLFGLEIQPDYAALARANAATNGIDFTVVEGDVLAMPAELKDAPFDHVIMNPPYFEADRRTSARDVGRETALSGAADTAAWCDAALKRLRMGGQVTAIHVPDRLPALLAAICDRAAVTIHPLAPRETRDANRVLLAARKGGRSPLRLAPTTVLHRGAAHLSDGEDYSEATAAVLRHAAAWPWLSD